MNSIPISAIERVEVLRDGASAIYGSDAVAGVLNFILNKEFEGVEVGGQYGQPTDSVAESQERRTSWPAGARSRRTSFNVTASLAYNKEKALFGKDRNYATVGTVLPYFVSGATGQGNIEGAFTPGTGSAAAGTWKEGTTVAGFGASPGSGYGNPVAKTNQLRIHQHAAESDPTPQRVPRSATTTRRPSLAWFRKLSVGTPASALSGK